MGVEHWDNKDKDNQTNKYRTKQKLKNEIKRNLITNSKFPTLKINYLNRLAQQFTACAFMLFP